MPVLPTPGSSPSRNTRPPAAACAATASAPSHCWSRGVSGRASGSGARLLVQLVLEEPLEAVGRRVVRRQLGRAARGRPRRAPGGPRATARPAAGARNGTASTHTRSPGPAVGSSGAGFAVRFRARPSVRGRACRGAAVRAVARVLAGFRRRPGMRLPLRPRHGKRRHRRNVWWNRRVTEDEPADGDERLAARTVGDAGPRVVFVHGLFGQGKNWTTIAKGLAENHRVTLIDLPNHGHSPVDRPRRLRGHGRACSPPSSSCSASRSRWSGTRWAARSR